MDLSPPSQPGVSRRRVAQTLGWSVPVIAVAAAAPTMAASPVGAIMFEFYDVYGTAFVGPRPTRLYASFSIQNTGGPNPVTITSIVVTVQFPASRVAATAPTAVTGPGWAYTSMSTSGGIRSFVFTWTGSLAPNASTSALAFEVGLVDNGPGLIVSTVNAVTNGGATATTSTSYLLN